MYKLPSCSLTQTKMAAGCDIIIFYCWPWEYFFYSLWSKLSNAFPVVEEALRTFTSVQVTIPHWTNTPLQVKFLHSNVWRKKRKKNPEWMVIIYCNFINFVLVLNKSIFFFSSPLIYKTCGKGFLLVESSTNIRAKDDLMILSFTLYFSFNYFNFNCLWKIVFFNCL